MPSPYCHSGASRRGSNHSLRTAVFLIATGLICAGCLKADVIAELPPVGAVARELPVGASGLSFPIIENEVLAGSVANNTGATLTFSDTGAAVSSRLEPGARYYVEVLDGTLEGERWDVDTVATAAAGGATVALDLSAGSLSTSHTLVAETLAGARCALRQHVTLSRLAAMFSPGLVGNNNSRLADGIHVLGEDGFIFHYLRSDGQTWRCGSSPLDMRDLVIPPDSAIVVELRSGPKIWTEAGAVRTNAFRKNLVAGLQSFATGFPLTLSPVEIGAFATDPSADPSSRWIGHENTDAADEILVFGAPDTEYFSWHLAGDGESWRQESGDGSDQAHVSFLPASGLILLRRGNADAGYIIPRPFDF